MSAIYYFCPDFPQPSGGIRNLYRHVWRLNQLGFQAAIVHQKHGFQLDWHSFEVPLLWLEDRPPFTPQDIWVFPEVMSDTVRKTSQFGGTRVVFSLSWLPSYSRLKPGERWQDHGVAHVITNSPTIQRNLAWSMDVETTLIPEFVDPQLYFPKPMKASTICYATRKDRSGSWLEGVFTRKGKPFTDFSWLALREMDEATYAQNLRSALIYLPTTTQEGTHISVLEAMACGCLVVGYSGIGGADYMVGEGEAQNCIMVENGDLLALGERLEEVLLQYKADPDHFQQIIDNALKTAERFQDGKKESDALVDFYNGLRETQA